MRRAAAADHRSWRARFERPPLQGLDRLHMFVPAIMSVGLVFWLVTMTRDLFAWRGERARTRRSRIAGAAVGSFVLDPRGGRVTSRTLGLRLRRSYLVSGVVLVSFAVYVLVGSAANYTHQGGYVGDIAWLLAVSVLVALVLVAMAGVAITVFVSWPDPPPLLDTILRRTPLTRDPDRIDELGEPSWSLSAASIVLPIVALIASGFIGSSRSVLDRIDVPVAQWARTQDALDVLEVWSGGVALAVLAVVALMVGVAGLRCRPFAVGALGVIAAAVVGTAVLRWMVERFPPLGPVPGSFPSGPVIAAVMISGVLPPAAAILARSWRPVVPMRAVLAVVAGLVALSELRRGAAWFTDVLVSGVIGVSFVVVLEWVLAHRRWHESCRGCIWAPLDPAPPLFSPIHLHVSHAKALRLAAHLSAFMAVLGLMVLTLMLGVPSNPDGSLVGDHIQRPVQLALAGMVSLGALLSWRWEALGAVLIAVAGVGLGVFAGLEYRPELALLMTGALLLPSVLLWLSWQHRRTTRSIGVLALSTLMLLSVTWFGASYVYGTYYGPTHPRSAVQELEVDRVRWVWSGALSSDGATVVAGLDTSDSEVVIQLRGEDHEVTSSVALADDDAVARVPIEGLRPDTDYSYTVVVDGQEDASRGRGALRTPAEGPMSFRLAVASCAMTGSNGSVFDAVRATDPLMYLSLGDMHYANPARNDPAEFRSALDRVLTAPAQAELYRQVPVAYVWDDHDYGANDADGSSPTRPAALSTYRQMVPNLAVEDLDAPINQAFTLGRVRIVMTDNRSERTGSSMLGREQLEWLIDELVRSSDSHAVVVWANPSPWIGTADPTSDTWAGFADERRIIADALAESGVDNLVMLSGDAHMVALDDGTNTAYASDGSDGFPLLHAAALDRPGSVKGGPYSGGTFPGGGQFGTLEVTDEGGPVTVELVGRTFDGRELVSEQFSFPAE